MGALLGQWYFDVIAGLTSTTALVIALYQIVCHLQNYTSPVYQRYIVRIIFMVPLYAVMSFLSLLMPQNSIYFDSIRDCYEAFVIYNFLSLCLAYVGGPGSVEVKMNGFQLEPSWVYMTCCLPPLPVNGRFVRMCKRGALQFVLLKPLLAALQIVLYTQGAFRDGHWRPDDGYMWIAIIYNVTYSVALYSLLLFYLGTHELLAPYNPLLKFAMVKMVVFLTFWQSLLVSVLKGVGVLATTEDQKNLQNFLICAEMLPAAVGMLFAFPYHEYKTEDPEAGGGQAGGLGSGVRHVISIRDVVSDTLHQFAPSYHDYVLYSNGGSKEAPRKVRTKTFVAVGHESANQPQAAKDHMKANLLANMELGVHGGSNPGEGPAEIQLQPLPGGVGRSDDPSFRVSGSSDDEFYSRPRQEECEDGPAVFSAPIQAEPDPAGGRKGLVTRMDESTEAGPPPDDFWLDAAAPSASAAAAAGEGQRAKGPGQRHPGRHSHGRHSPQKQRLKLPPRGEQPPQQPLQPQPAAAAAAAARPQEEMQEVDLQATR